MIRKVYEVDPMVCPRCGGEMRVIAFLTDYAVVDRIINPSLTQPDGLIYASSRWLKGKAGLKRLTRSAPQKSKFLSIKSIL